MTFRHPTGDPARVTCLAPQSLVEATQACATVELFAPIL
jgi:hypothetical protein